MFLLNLSLPVTSHCWISIKHDTSLHCFCRHNTQHPHSTCSCVQALLVHMWWIYTYLYFVVYICTFKNIVTVSADHRWTVILCVLLVGAMNYSGSLLVFGMSESSFFVIDVNVLDVSVIITNAVLLHLQKMKYKFMHLWECLLVLKMMTI